MKLDLRLKSKTALITGGSDGIGFGIAEALASEGADLVIVARDREKLALKKDYLKKYNVKIIPLSADLSNQESVSMIVKEVRAKDIQIDILVNNAAIARFVPFLATDEQLLDSHWYLNAKVPYLLTQAFLDDLISSQGNVINISSYFAKRMLLDRPSTAYSMTKGALESFTKALAFELGSRGVRVNAIAPGVVITPQVKRNLDLLSASARDRFYEMNKYIYPLQTLGEPKDIANMVVFLASDQAKWITGGVFSVDGGLTTN